MSTATLARRLEPLPLNRSVIEPADILTPEQLASRLQVPLSWIYEKSRASGKHGNPLPVLRCGRYLRFCWSDVCSWLRERKA